MGLAHVLSGTAPTPTLENRVPLTLAYKGVTSLPGGGRSESKPATDTEPGPTPLPVPAVPVCPSCQATLGKRPEAVLHQGPGLRASVSPFVTRGQQLQSFLLARLWGRGEAVDIGAVTQESGVCMGAGGVGGTQGPFLFAEPSPLPQWPHRGDLGRPWVRVSCILKGALQIRVRRRAGLRAPFKAWLSPSPTCNWYMGELGFEPGTRCPPGLFFF